MEDNEKSLIEQGMEILDGTHIFVQSMNGVKKQFVAEGWSENNAEQMVIYMLAASNNKQTEAKPPTTRNGIDEIGEV